MVKRDRHSPLEEGILQLGRRVRVQLATLTTAVAITAMGPGRYSLDGALGWAEAISGPWWSLGVIGLAALVAFATLTISRDVWDEASAHFEPDELAQLVWAITVINAWNRVAIATRMFPAA